MYRYFSTFLLIVLMAFWGVFLTQAQNAKIPKKGSSIEIGNRFKADKINETKNQTSLKPLTTQILKFNNVIGTIDTLSYRKDNPGDWSNTGVGFGQNANDVMVQWYKAPADLIIKAVGVGGNLNDNLQPAAVKLVKLINYTDQDIRGLAVETSAGSNLGYFPGEPDGWNNIAPYEFDNTGNASGPWVPVDNNPIPWEDLWSENGNGAPIIPTVQVHDPAGNNYDWVEMSLLGVEPTVLRDEIFGISFANTGSSLDDVQSLFAIFGESISLAVPALKFYEYERTAGTGNYGWWVRPVVLDLVAIVDIFGDAAPTITGVTQLSTTLSSDPRTVEATIIDTNPGGGASGVQSATLKWSTDNGTTWNDVAMTNTSGDIYSGDIPGQSGGTTVQYYIEAVDVESNVGESLPSSYSVFGKENNILFIDNSSDLSAGTMRFFYLGAGTANPLDHDYWRVADDGIVEMDALLALYDAVIQVDGSYPDSDLSGNIEAWIATGTAGNPKSYFLTSQDYGCYITGGNCYDTTFVAGEFQYDYLGVGSLSPQDFGGGGNIGMQIVGVNGDPISGWVEQYKADNSVTYWYDPAAEIGFTNWIDAIVPTAGATTIFTEPASGNVVGVRNQGTGFYTSFHAFDYLACNFVSDSAGSPFQDPSYAWGIEVTNQAYAFFTWSGVVSVKRENNLLPEEYKLSQNYPNPFNPTTSIKFSIPEASNVVLKVYDILGSEVAVLVNKEMQAGNYNVDFDASKLASGMYIYSIKAGDFNVTKKMMLLK